MNSKLMLICTQYKVRNENHQYALGTSSIEDVLELLGAEGNR